MGGIKLGKILGFEIGIDWSWLFIFFFIAYTLAVGWFPAYYKFTPGVNWGLGFAGSILLFVCVLIHELSHSVVSRRYGTEVRGITLFLFGGVSQTADEPKGAHEEFWMAIAGPVASLVLAGFFYALRQTGFMLAWPLPTVAILSYLGFINLMLGLFNLVPGYPLDGGRVLRSIIWGVTKSIEKATRYASSVGQGIGYLMMAVGVFFILGVNLVGGLWLMFIGWFLVGAARSSYQQMQIRQALAGVSVEQVMTTAVPVIPAEMTVRQFVDEQLLRHDYSCYPVTEAEHVIGVIGAEEVRTVPSSHWESTNVGAIAHRVDGAYAIRKEDDAWEALVRLSTEKICRLMVMENDHLEGTVGRDSLYRLVQTKMHLPT